MKSAKASDLLLFHRFGDQLSDDNLINPHTSNPRTAQFWSQVATPSFSILLERCKYSPKLQSHFLSLFMHVISHFPDPTSKHKTKLNGDGTPYDISWNYDSATSTSTVRFSYDLFGSPRTLIKDMEKDGFLREGSADLTLLDDAMNHFVDAAYGEHPPYLFSAIDCQPSGESMYKVYFRPAINNARVLCHQRGVDLFHHWDATFFEGGLKQAYSVIDRFNENFPLEKQQTIHMLAWDCTKPSPRSRIKLYMYYSTTSLKTVRDMWTQRGQLTGPEIDQGLECINELLKLLYMDGKDIGDETELKSREGREQTICMNLEMRQGDAMPVPKMYFQPSKFGKKSDLEIAVALQKWFALKKIDGLSQSFASDMAGILKHRNLKKDAGSISYLTLAVKKGGHMALTVYFRPRIYKTLEEASSGVRGPLRKGLSKLKVGLNLKSLRSLADCGLGGYAGNQGRDGRRSRDPLEDKYTGRYDALLERFSGS